MQVFKVLWVSTVTDLPRGITSIHDCGLASVVNRLMTSAPLLSTICGKFHMLRRKTGRRNVLGRAAHVFGATLALLAS